MSMTEYIEWQALLTIVEPQEAEERAAQMRTGRR